MKKRTIKKVAKVIGIIIIILLLITAVVISHFVILQAPIARHEFDEKKINCVYHLKYDDKIIYKIGSSEYYLTDESNNLYSKVTVGNGYILIKASEDYMVFETTHGKVAVACQQGYKTDIQRYEILYQNLNIWEAWKLQDVIQY